MLKVVKATMLALGGLGVVYYRSPAKQQSQLDGYLYSGINSVLAVKVLASSVFDYTYSLKNIDYDSEEYHKARSQVHFRVANRILGVSVRSRGIYFKAGQYLGNLDRIMPAEFTQVLSVLQDSAPPLSYDQIIEVINQDLPGALSQFKSFDKEAIAAASLAQVHKAELSTGQTVAVKIQYPFLLTQTPSDFYVLKIITQICNVLLKYYEFEGIDLLKIWETFKDMCIQEVDFLHEKKNSEITKKIFCGDSSVYVPDMVDELCCSRVLVMEFVEGVKSNDVEGIKGLGLKNQDVANALIDAFGKMIFLEGHVHCDPHPGNIFVRKVGGRPQIVLLDHGFYRYVSSEFRMDFCRLWQSLINHDYTKVEEIAKKLGLGEYYRYLPLILLYRTMGSTKPIGENLTVEEKRNLHRSQEVTFEKVTNLMQRLPPDLIFISRTSNLIAINNLKLGGTTRHRMMKFTDFSLMALYKGWRYYWQKLKLFVFLLYNRL